MAVRIAMRKYLCNIVLIPYPLHRLGLADSYHHWQSQLGRNDFTYGYQLTIAKLPLAKDLDDFQFNGNPY